MMLFLGSILLIPVSCRCARIISIIFFSAAVLLPGCTTDRGDKVAEIKLEPPYTRSEVVGNVTYHWPQWQRLAPGSDNWPTTWASDDAIYTAWGDGGGFGGTNSEGRVSLGVARVLEGPTDYKVENLWGGAHSRKHPTYIGKSYGILAVDSTLYMWVSPDDGRTLYYGNRLHFSNDNGISWTAAPWEFSQPEGMITPTFLQFGKGYSDALDGYIYIYANHLTVRDFSTLSVHTPGEIFLIRCPKEDLLVRDSYQFYAGTNAEKNPLWTADIGKKVPVFMDSNGVGWNTSAFYHPHLKRVFLITEHYKSKSACIGIFEGSKPWGPWFTVDYNCNFGSGHIELTTFYWNVPTKWITGPDEFTMVFTGVKSNDSWNTVRANFSLKQASSEHREQPK